MKQSIPVVLASNSVFRKKALDILGLPYTICPSKINEKTIRDSNPLRMAQKISEAKAQSVGEQQPDSLVIAADLFVTQNKTVFEKPKNRTEARQMLNAFSGNELTIVTGLAVFNSKTQHMFSAAETCTVEFRKLSEHEIADYISRYPVTEFAGAFDSDGLLRFAKQVKGNYNFHAALPMNRLVEFLNQNGLKV